MDLVRVRRANAIMEQALDSPPDARDGLIETLCGADTDTEMLVRRLLARAEAGGEALLDDAHRRDSALWREAAQALAAPLAVAPGLRLGRWRIVRRLGHGGMSEVYLAERDDDSGVAQQVAIKLLLPGLDGAEVLARFARERQVLARLSHPNIARLFDAGVAPDGRPYFVMEYVRGERIDQWCDRRQLGIAQRLHLVLQVCAAVAHAHAALVVHRDIKPGNVLVDDEGNARLLDFGIAKLIDEAGGLDATSGTGAPVTLGFASPEQISGGATGVATDVYQLGLLLFVLLAGRRPHPSQGLSREEFAATLRAQAPSPAAVLRAAAISQRERVAEIATARRTTVRKLIGTLGGDIQNVVAKAIAPEPARRYHGVPQFGDDLRRVLDGRPVAARGDGVFYVVGRYVRRHAVASGAIALLFAGIVAVAVFASMLALQLQRERGRAQDEAGTASATLDFMVDAFKSADPRRAQGQEATIAAALARGAEGVDERFAAQPAVRHRLHLVFGEVYESLGRYPDAEQQFAHAAEAAQALPERGEAAPVAALAAQGRIAFRLGRMDEARRIFEALLVRVPDDNANARLRLGFMSNLSGIHMVGGRYDEALATSGRALALRRTLDGPDHPDTLQTANNHAVILNAIAHDSLPARDEARALRDDLFARATRVLGPDHPATLQYAMARAAFLLLRDQQPARSVEAYRPLLPRAYRVLGERHPSVLEMRRNYGAALAAAGEVEAGLQELRDTIAALREMLPPDHGSLGAGLAEYAAILAGQGRDEEALAALREALTTRYERRLIERDTRLAALLERAAR